MITYRIDNRVDPSQRDKISEKLDNLKSNPAVAAILSNFSRSIMVTTKNPNDAGDLPEHITSIGGKFIIASDVDGPGLDYSRTATGIDWNSYDTILLISQNEINDSLKQYTFGATDEYPEGEVKSSLSRTIFHELMHLQFKWDDKPVGINFEEELAVFSENVIYLPIAQALGEHDSAVAYGHAVDHWDGKGRSGTVSFEAYLKSPTGHVGIDYANTNAKIATFKGTDGSSELVKTYHNEGYNVGQYSYDHYIVLTEKRSQGSYLDAAVGFVSGSRLDILTSDMMHGDVQGAINLAIGALKAVHGSHYSQAMSFDRVTGLGADAWGDTKDHVNVLRYVGPASAGTSDTGTPDWLEIDDQAASLSTILVGAGGKQGDVLRAGSGNDLIIAAGSVHNIVHGNGGDDILVGTDADDRLYGGADNNILIGRGGQNHLVGGSGSSDRTIAYYGDRPQGIIVYDGLDRVEHDGVLDTIVDIKGFVGTKWNDVFVADGKGHTFYGNGGTDEFLAASGGDTFRGVNGVISGTISFAALLTSGIEIGETGTNVGHVYDRPNLIIGSSQVDVIKLSSTSRIAVRAGGGDDDITVSKGNAYGEGGNDTFRVVAGIVGSIIDGGDDEDTIFFESSYVPDAYVSINWEDDRPGYAYKTANGFMGGATLVSIEKFDFSKDGVAIKTHLRANTNNTITGTDRGNDEIIGGHLIDIIHAGGSSQSLTAGYHNILNGRDGDDRLYGATNGDPNLHGDWLIGGSGNDKIYGSAGKDRIDGGYGSTDDDELHGGAGDDLFFDASGTNRIWGDDGVDTLNIASYSRSQLTFGITDGWHVVAAKDGSFTTYLHSVERIVTRNGTVSAEGVRIARAASDPADQHVLDDTGFDFSGFDMTPKPDPEFVEVEVSSTGEGPFYLISEQDVLDFGSYPSAQADDTLIFYPDTPNGNAAAAAEAMPFDSYAGSFNQTTYQHEIDQMSLYGVYTQAPIHHDMLII